MVEKTSSTPEHPLAEVFGFPTDNHSLEAQRHRRTKLCPYNNNIGTELRAQP